MGPFLWSIHDTTLLSLCIVWAGISDGLDGFLARRFNTSSRFGEMLDPIADKIFIGSLILLLLTKELIPTWFVLLTIGRDIAILIGGLIAKLKYNIKNMPPTLSSKINTALQFVTLFTSLWLIQYVSFMIVLTSATTIISGLEYGYVFKRMAKK